MRILWLVKSQSPWNQADGWDFLKDFRFEFVRATSATDARAKLNAALPIAVSVINADLPGALELIAAIKSGETSQRTPIILVSEKWGKKDFKAHSISSDAADNYARLPLPPSGFVDVIAQLTETPREELGAASSNTLGSIVPNAEDPSSLLVPEESQATIPPPAPTPAPVEVAPAPPVPSARQRSPMQAIREAITPWKKSEGVEKPEPVAPLGSYNKADADVLRKYLDLREQELARSLRDKNNLEQLFQKVTKEVEDLHKQMRELEHEKSEVASKMDRQEKRHNELERAITEAKEKASFEKESLQERIKYLETQLEESREKYSGLKDRVRKDIRKIQAREKELETRLELVKKDSETLISERDRQVLELRRKIDSLEFDLDLVQDRKVQAENNAHKYVDKLSRVARTLQVAFGMLEEAEEEKEKEEFSKPIMGGAAAGAKSDESDIERLLKTPAKDLDSQQIAEAEAPTRIFDKEENEADKLLSGVIDTEPGEGEAAGNDDLDQALG